MEWHVAYGSPLMLFIWSIKTKKQELTCIENTGGLGARLQRSME